MPQTPGRLAAALRKLLNHEGAAQPSWPGGGARILVEAELIREVIEALDPKADHA